MNYKPIFTLLVSITFFASAMIPTALADEAMLLSMIQDLQKNMQQMQGTIDWQSKKINQLEGRRGSNLEMEESSGDFADNLHAHIGDADKWLKDLKFSGDFRLRYEALQESSGSTVVGVDPTRKRPDRNRFRYRLRFGFEKGFDGPFHEDDKMKVGFRLVSATAGQRTSTNTTLDSQFDFDNIAIDRAYATYYPGWAKWTTDDGIGFTGMHTTAGKFKNPYLLGSTWAVFDSDVTPEGLYQQLNFSLLKSDDLDIKNTTTLGQLILEEGGGVDHDDAELYAYQTVFESKIKAFTEKPIKMKNAVSFYDFNDFGLPGNFGIAGTNATRIGSGRGTLASSFAVVDIYNELAFPLEFHKAKGFKVYHNFFKNAGDHANFPGELKEEDMGWMIGAKLGKAKKKGTWELKYEYANIEANASPDVFNDSDFGGTDRRGSVIKAGYAFTDHLKFNLAAFYTNRLGADSRTIDAERDLYQFDLVWKF